MTTPTSSPSAEPARAVEVDPTKPRQPDRSLGDLVGELSQELRDLVRGEVDLAKVELKQEAVRAGKGGGLLGGGAVAGHLAILLLSFAAAWGIATVINAGWAFLIVGFIWAVIAAVLGLQGRMKLQKVNVVPEQTVETVQEDVQWAKNQLK